MSAALIQNTLFTLALASIGAAVAYAVGSPAPFLTGPALFVSLGALSGLKAVVPSGVRDLCFLLIGVNMGANVTPEAVATAAKWPGSLMVLAVAVAVIFIFGAKLMQKLFGMDRLTSVLAAAPGHLSFVLSLSTDTKADMRRVALVQSLRVLALTLIVPFVVPAFSEVSTDIAAPHPAPLFEVAIMLALSLALGFVFQRLNVPAALLLSAMAVSSVAHALSIIEGSAPLWMTVAGFTTMGALIGTRFTGITFRMVVQSLGAAICLTGFASIIAVIGALIVTQLTGLPMVSAVIAFAPGGLETMMAMSVLMDADPAYVAVHHVARLFFLTFLIPLLVSAARK